MSPADIEAARLQALAGAERRRLRLAGALRNDTIGTRQAPAEAVSDASLDVDQPIFYDGVSFIHKDAANFNTALGTEALDSLSFGGFNSAVGHYALTSNTGGYGNTAVGSAALRYNDYGAGNTAIGDYAMRENEDGSYNTAVGQYALSYNLGYDTGYGVYASNTAVGFSAARYNSTGNFNVAVGYNAMRASTTGFRNTALGSGALSDATTAVSNIAVGRNAGSAVDTGSYNILIGSVGAASESYTTRIGYSQTRAFVSGISGVTTDVDDAVAVLVDSAGQLGTTSSSRRYKEDIRDMADASESILELRPVTFRYKKRFENGGAPVQFGLVAEEVAEVFPELVVRDEQGRPDAVKYRLLSVMLLNEVQKLQRQVEELQVERAPSPETR